MDRGEQLDSGHKNPRTSIVRYAKRRATVKGSTAVKQVGEGGRIECTGLSESVVRKQTCRTLRIPKGLARSRRHLGWGPRMIMVDLQLG
ncbi:hypothetical protein PM082_009110 [Marasmius tenuissimus]|nr:hypothetical protein PM082_009110 [Marasmius tenuissimus]